LTELGRVLLKTSKPMSKKYRIRNPYGHYFLTHTVVDWLDVFTRNEYKDIVVDTLKYYQVNKGLEIMEWCLMTNHLHMIAKTDGLYQLDALIRDFKKFSSRELAKAITVNPRESRKKWLLSVLKSHNGAFWQRGYSVELEDSRVIEQKCLYIRMNPVKAGFSDCPEAYVYSSAYRDFNGSGLLELIQGPM
jgi:REP element-mobilizing transposase RayT